MAMKKSGWSDVLVDVIFELVVNRKELSLADIGRMTAVCKSWRSILKENHWFGLRENVDIWKTTFPWLMLVESKASNSCKRRFFNPATGEVSELYLPEAKARRCCGSGYGWIVTMGKDMEIKLLNPLTRNQLMLPSQLTFSKFGYGISNTDLHEDYTRKQLRSMFITKAALTCSPSSAECLVVALLGAAAHLDVVIAKPGDITWTHLPHLHPSIDRQSTLVADLLVFEGKLFCITLHGNLIVLDLNDKYENFRWRVISSILPDDRSRTYEVKFDFDRDFSFYLVRIRGDFVVVIRQRDIKTSKDYRTHKIVAYKLLEKGEWQQIQEIGDCCLFLGTNESICLSPTPRGLNTNCIYFTDDLKFSPGFYTVAGQDMVVYSMERKEFTQLCNQQNLLSKYSPSLWVTLNSS